MDIGCPVSCKFPHGTLHYQSRKVFVLPSRRSYFLLSASHVRIYSDFPLFLSGTGVFGWSFSLLFHLLCFPSLPRASQFRSPLLSGSRLICLLGTKMFQFPSFSNFFVCFRMYGIQDCFFRYSIYPLTSSWLIAVSNAISFLYLFYYSSENLLFCEL